MGVVAQASARHALRSTLGRATQIATRIRDYSLNNSGFVRLKSASVKPLFSFRLR